MSQDSRKQYKTYQDIYRERLAVLANASAASALSPRQAGSGQGAASPESPKGQQQPSKGHQSASKGLGTQTTPSTQMSGPPRTRGRAAAAATLHSLDDVTPSAGAGAAASAPAPTGATLGGLDELETVSPTAVTPPSASGSQPASMQGPRFGRYVMRHHSSTAPPLLSCPPHSPCWEGADWHAMTLRKFASLPPCPDPSATTSSQQGVRPPLSLAARAAATARPCSLHPCQQ